MKCPSCPLADRPEGCDGESVARYCHLVASSRTDYAAFLYRKATGERHPSEPAPAPPPPAFTPPPPAEVPPPPPAIPLAVTLAVVNCPARGRPIECGCAAERRYCGETLDVMTWDGCVACQQQRVTPDGRLMLITGELEATA